MLSSCHQVWPSWDRFLEVPDPSSWSTSPQGAWLRVFCQANIHARIIFSSAKFAKTTPYHEFQFLPNDFIVLGSETRYVRIPECSEESSRQHTVSIGGCGVSFGMTAEFLGGCWIRTSSDLLQPLLTAPLQRPRQHRLRPKCNPAQASPRLHSRLLTFPCQIPP